MADGGLGITCSNLRQTCAGPRGWALGDPWGHSGSNAALGMVWRPRRRTPNVPLYGGFTRLQAHLSVYTKWHSAITASHSGGHPLTQVF